MATLYLTLSRKEDKSNHYHEVLARFVVGSRINQRAKTNIFVPAQYWDAKNQSIIIPKLRLLNNEQKELIETLNNLKKRLTELRTAIDKSFIEAGAGKQPLASNWLVSAVNKTVFPERYIQTAKKWSLVEGFIDYLNNLQQKGLSEQRKKNTKVVLRSVLRYESYKGKQLYLDDLTTDDLRDFENYIRNEGAIVEKYPELLSVCEETRHIEKRGENTIIGRMSILRAVILFNLGSKHTSNNPFQGYVLQNCLYGTPYYITSQERDRIYNTNLSRHPRLAEQRDIFVFQCLVGCRVSDLLVLTQSNLINGAIEYIPQKTKSEKPETVRVPLTSTAKEIVEKYKGTCGESLLPFISAQNYNLAIKRIFLAARLRRLVTVINPLTRQEEKKPLNEIASSHIARRTFIGNLYKQVQDPNLIGKLSGHAEGSKAFARYRVIDEELKSKVVNLLEIK